MIKPSNEQAANLLDQIPFSVTAAKQESPQDSNAKPQVTNAKPQVTIEAAMTRIEANGFSVLLDHLKAESLKQDKRVQERRDLLRRYAA
ncbi:MAG: hypothetical protein JKX85_14975 [Phycisphaeraceae bacterium]|nr:hypothetical protein [Phycisphaeraceae bacterium]